MKQLRDYIVKSQEIYVGLEDSKKTWVITVRCGGVIAHETRMPADYTNLKNYFRNKFPECKIKVMYEAGFRGFTLYDRLTADGWECVVTPPNRVTEEKSQRKKNDRNDGRRLAKNLESNDYTSCHVPDKALREDRQLSRTYTQIQKDLVRVRNRVRRTLEFHGLDEKLPSGRWQQKQYNELLSHLAEIDLSYSLKRSLEFLLHQLEQLRQLKKDIHSELFRLSEEQRYSENVEILMSVPGIGKLTAIRLNLEWGDISRFQRKENFSSFLGLVPSEYSTGEFERKGHITKEGNRQVRAWLIESAWIAIRNDGVLHEKFLRVWKNSGSKKKAIVATARKLALRLRSILLKRTRYQIGVVC